MRAKSKQAKSRRLSLKQPVLQMDFSFLGDKPGEEQVTILNVVDVLSGMALPHQGTHTLLAGGVASLCA